MSRNAAIPEQGGALEVQMPSAGRRNFIAVAGAAAMAVVAPGVSAQARTADGHGLGPLSQRYPDPLIQVIDPSFARYQLGLAKVERIASGMRWCEGPVWFGDGRFLLWSDIPNNRMMRWEEETGRVSVFRKPSNNGNGNTRDRQGRLITCEHLTRRVTRTEHQRTPLFERVAGDLSAHVLVQHAVADAHRAQAHQRDHRVQREHRTRHALELRHQHRHCGEQPGGEAGERQALDLAEA